MTALSAIFAGLLVAWPAPVADANGIDRGVAVASTPFGAPHDPLAVWAELARRFRDDDAAQVRIEQHIIWRIAPVRGPGREAMLAMNPLPPDAKLTERKMGECIPMSAIAGGRPQRGSRLLLFLRDRRMVAADLEKACLARDFYSGFYVDKPNSDGKLCVDRDRILARSGARCEITSFRQLVPDD